MYGAINSDDIKNDITECLKQYNAEYDLSHNGLIRALQQNYWELEDNEILEKLKEIKSKLEKNIFSFLVYPRILYVLLCINEIQLEDFNFEEYITLMKHNIKESNDVNSFESGLFIQNKSIKNEYEKYISEFNKLLNNSNENNRKNYLTNIFNKDNWGEELESCINENRYHILELFWNDLDCKLTIKKLSECKLKDINNFIYACYKCDIEKKDVERVNEFLSLLNELIEKEKSKTHKYNFKILKDELTEYVKNLR